MTNTPFKFLQKAKFKCNLLRRLGKSGQDLERSAGAEGRAGSRCWLHPPLSLHPDLLPRLLGNVCRYSEAQLTYSSVFHIFFPRHLQTAGLDRTYREVYIYIVVEAYACPRTVRVIPKVAWYLEHWLEGKSDHCMSTSYWLQGFSHHGLGPGQRRTRAISPKG